MTQPTEQSRLRATDWRALENDDRTGFWYVSSASLDRTICTSIDKDGATTIANALNSDAERHNRRDDAPALPGSFAAGMSMRDLYRAAALAGLLANPNNDRGIGDTTAEAGHIADEMLRKRGAK